MNIWALNKDDSVRQALVLLQNHLGMDSFVVEASDELHPCAVFLQHRNDPAFRAYLYTLGQVDQRYAVHLEYPEDMTNVNLIDAYENLSMRALVDILAVHFEVALIEDPSWL